MQAACRRTASLFSHLVSRALMVTSPSRRRRAPAGASSDAFTRGLQKWSNRNASFLPESASSMNLISQWEKLTPAKPHSRLIGGRRDILPFLCRRPPQQHSPTLHNRPLMPWSARWNPTIEGGAREVEVEVGPNFQVALIN